MIRLTRVLLVGLFTGIALPAWSHLPSTYALRGQQPAAKKAHDDDSDDAMDTSDDNDSDDDQDTENHSSHPSANPGGQRTVDVMRMIHPARDTVAPMAVNINYGKGDLSLVPADGPWLYAVRVNYQPGLETPKISYDANSRSLFVGGKKQGDDIDIEFGGHHDHSGEDLRVALARKVPLHVALTFGAADASAELGGLSVQQLSIETGVADASVSFNSPNPVPLENFDLKSGAAHFSASGLGNARVQHMTVRGVASAVDLDFGGHWTNDMTLDLQAVLGAVNLHLPQGVLVDTPSRKTIIGEFDDSSGPTTPQTPGGQVYHLHLVTNATLGAINIDRKTGE